jgi:hypothetical protein
MAVKDIIHFIDKREGLQTFLSISLYFFIFFLIIGLGIYFEGSDERNDKEMIEIANKCKADALACDFVSAHEKLNTLASDRDGANEYDYQRIKEKRYNEVFDYVFNAEAMFLCAKGDKESIDRITFLLSSIPVKGIAIPEGTPYEYEHDFDSDTRDLHKDYIEYASSFNQKCDVLIDLAISNNNYLLIKKVIPLFKTVPEQLKSHYKRHLLEYSNSSKKNAILKINKAIRDGVFPNVTQEIK